MELAGCNSILILLCLQQYDTISVRLPTNAKALLLFIESPIWDSAGGCTICVADVRYPQYILEDNMEGKGNKRVKRNWCSLLETAIGYPFFGFQINLKAQ
jgi:hypothetical protein